MTQQPRETRASVNTDFHAVANKMWTQVKLITVKYVLQSVTYAILGHLITPHVSHVLGPFYTSAQNAEVESPHKPRGKANRAFNEEIYKNARSNLDERFWRLHFGVSPASSVSNAVGGVVNASARNVVQSTCTQRFIRLSQRGVSSSRCSIQRNLFARSRRAHRYTMFSKRNIRTEKWRQHVGQK
jgi:hypothetical protein